MGLFIPAGNEIWVLVSIRLRKERSLFVQFSKLDLTAKSRQIIWESSTSSYL